MTAEEDKNSKERARRDRKSTARVAVAVGVMRDSKSKARARTSSATVPGAVHESSTRSTSPKGRPSKRDRLSDDELSEKGSKEHSKSRKNRKSSAYDDNKDEKHKYRKSSSKEVKPGAVSESHSSKEARASRRKESREKSDAPRSKQRAKTNTPGASRSTNGRQQEKLDAVFSDETKVENDIHLEAMAVGDAENQQIKDQQAEIKELRRQMNNMTVANQQAALTNQPNEEGTSATPTKSYGKYICGVLLLLAIGGGVAGYVFGTRNTETATAPEAPPSVITTSPSPTVVTTPLPTDTPSGSPTKLQVYDPPSDADCLAIANGSPVTNQDSFQSNGFAVDFDVTLLFDTEQEVWTDAFTNSLQTNLIATLTGCSTDTSNRRRLGQSNIRKRSLQLADYAIANGNIVSVTVGQGGCKDDTSELCYRVRVSIDLWLRDGDAKGFQIVGLLVSTLGDSPVNFLQLQTIMSSVEVVRAAPTDPTNQPTTNPTSNPSSIPTSYPTETTSTSPTGAPVAGPTTGQPTGLPSAMPTLAPVTFPTTDIPSATPTAEGSLSPTLAPIVGPSPPPTAAPTKTPTVSPTSSPTSGPSSSPTQAPSSAPSMEPSFQPSSLPSLLPSQAPTAIVSVITPSATAIQSSKWTCAPGICHANGTRLQDLPGDASKAIDGNTDNRFFMNSTTHTASQLDAWWRVDGIAGSVSSVKLYARDCCQSLLGCTVSLLDSDGTTLASQIVEGTDSDFEFTLNFGNVAGVESVKVLKPGLGIVAITEAEVFDSSGQSLITSSSRAFQSSEMNCDICLYPTPFDGDASLVIDGNTDGAFTAYTTAFTKRQSHPYIAVDLGLTATVKKVVIWNRTDPCCTEWLRGAILDLVDGSGNVIYTETIQSSDASIIFDIPAVENVEMVRVRKDRGDGFAEILIAEIEAFGFIQE